MDLKFLPELSSDYKRLFEEEIEYDVIIYAGKEPNVKEIHAHSNILCTKSQYFRIAFSKEWAKKQDGKFILRKPNISPHLFSIILRFIYYGNIELKNIQNSKVLKLLKAVDELDIQQLFSYIQEYLIEHLTEFLKENPISILKTVYRYESFTDLYDLYFENICEEPEIIFNSVKFIDLKAPLLEILLRRDDLNMEEIKIWEGLLKWCFYQQNMINNPTKWSKDDITEIKTLLHRFIPLIKFYDIKSADFFYKVYCYKEILPQDLIHNLLEFHLISNMKPKPNITPSRKPKLNSNLIKSKYIPLFASWIDRKGLSYNNNNIPYKFELLCRSDRDGFNASFYKTYNKKGAIIWIAKIQGTKQLVGVYNPFKWIERHGWKNTEDGFLFNFSDGEDISTAKLEYFNNADCVIYCHNNDDSSNIDDLDCNNSNSNRWTYYTKQNYYPNINIPATFMIENYEVFLVESY